mmetsp:Transcript_23166/g.53083  ORF Transcript_23166/g.53083 Transcript_23166/m.53083 type:complete len:92 (+) Transcript_23166:126-401(+)
MSYSPPAAGPFSGVTSHSRSSCVGVQAGHCYTRSMRVETNVSCRATERTESNQSAPAYRVDRRQKRSDDGVPAHVEEVQTVARQLWNPLLR